MKRQLVAVGVFFALTTIVSASEAPLDRSALSYDENVIINTVCASADHKGKSAYNDCVRAQLESLQKHPSPDRSGLSPEKNRAIEHLCNDFRNSGFVEYNDCLNRAMTATDVPQAPEEGDFANVSLAKVFD